MKIGVFDSGLGGLTILKQLLIQLPEYSYIYLGDNARVPYGNRSPEIIYKYTQQALTFLVKHNCKLIIIACNTSTASCLKKIQNTWLPKNFPDRKVLGVIKPTVEEIGEGKFKRVGVLATYSTVKSNSFVKEIAKLDQHIAVFQNSAPLFVPLIEAGEWQGQMLDYVIGKYTKPLLKHKIDSLILGCTHYEIIRKSLSNYLGKKIYLITEGHLVAKKLKHYLSQHQEINQALNKNKTVDIYVTDKNEYYQQMAQKFLGKKLLNNHQLIRVVID